MKLLSKIILGSLVTINLTHAKTLIEQQEESLVNGVIPSTKVAKVERSQIDGFYKAYLDNGNILYVNPFKRVIFIGELYTNTGVSLTANDRDTWQSELNNKQVKDLNLKEVIQYAKKVNFNKGSKKYDFILFTDPECPFCARVEELFIKKDVSVYINFYPLSFHPHAEKWSKEILSAPNFKDAFLKLRETQKDLNIKITSQAEQTLKNMKLLGEKLNIMGTPKIFIVDKKENKIIDVIDGANLEKINSYLDKDKQ